MKNDESKVIDFPVATEVPPTPQDEKIVMFQIVSPNQCIFLCLSNSDTDNKLEIGMIRR